jgi:hypothetical protein
MSPNTIKSERTSNVASFAIVPRPEQRRLKWKALVWLALPLTLAAGCASDPSRPAVVNYSPDTPAPSVGPASERQAADRVIGKEIYDMCMADKKIHSSMWASVDQGVVTLHGRLPNGAERQRIIDRITGLPGVNQVNYITGDVAPTAAQIAGDGE